MRSRSGAQYLARQLRSKQRHDRWRWVAVFRLRICAVMRRIAARD